MKVIVTGATKGIGRAIVEAYAAQGEEVAFCARTEADVFAFQQLLQQSYPNRSIIAKAVDMSDKSAIQAFAKEIIEEWNSVDILVNNAGVFKPGAISEEADGMLELQIETNLYSAYYMTRAVLPTLQAQKSGHVVNMCSIASFMAYPNGGSYSISKFAMLGFSKVLREEMKAHNIRVTAVMPGATWSASWDGAPFPKDRLMNAEDIAHTVLSVTNMQQGAVVEEVIIRPQLGDL